MRASAYERQTEEEERLRWEQMDDVKVAVRAPPTPWVVALRPSGARLEPALQPAGVH